MTKKAFTLIELLVVVLIVGILAAIAYPQYEKAVYRAELAAGLPLGAALAEEANVFYLANSRFPVLEELSSVPALKNIQVSCAQGGEEGEASNCGLVDIGLPIRGMGYVTVWFVASPDVFKGTSFEGVRRLCLADQYVKIASITNSLCVGLGGRDMFPDRDSGMKIYSW